MASKIVTSAINSNKVAVFSKSYCPYCTTAKRALDAELGKGKYFLMELENRKDMAQIQDYLGQLTGARSVPRVFINGKCIGGGNETSALHRSGELKRLLSVPAVTA